MNLTGQPVYGHIPTVTWALAGAIRFGRLERDRFYWTPFQVGAGYTSGAFILHTSTEIGGRIASDAGAFVDLGVGLGLGISAIDYWNDCDGSCLAGAGGPMLSPAVRAGFAGSIFSVAAVASLLLVANWVDTFEQGNLPFLFGLDLALRKERVTECRSNGVEAS